MKDQTMENKIELRKAEKPSQYLSRITRVDTEADFYVELEEDSEDVYEIVAGGEVVGLAYIDDDEEAKDEKEAWERYMAYTKQGGSRTFTELLEHAGLKTPFDEACLKTVCEAAKKWLDEFDMSGIE